MNRGFSTSVVRAALMAGVAALWIMPAGAQEPQPDSTDSQPSSPPVGKRSFTPAEFARFAPRTAYDMLVQIPGFTLRSADQERGLGQASENVLIGGQRITNKQGGAIDELTRIPIRNVERIEIVDAASLGIAGLTGQVANVILKAERAGGGQFLWNPDFRAHYSKPNLFGGQVSYSGTKGPLDYTFSVRDDVGRGAYGGPVTISDGDGNLIERRHEVFHSEYDRLILETKLGFDGPGSSRGNLTLGYKPYWSPYDFQDDRELVTGETRHRSTKRKLKGWQYDVNADYEFALGPGRLKLIGLRHFDHEPLVVTQILHFDIDNHNTGIRLDRNTRSGETIARAEYGWKGGRNDWQLSLERAYNSLDQKGKLFDLDGDGQFVEVPFPGGSGKVTETRYEAVGSLSRPLSSNLDLQVAAGAEISRLAREDSDLPARKFFRPKGSVTLGWRPAKDWDVNLSFRRRVGQISFYDFLSQPSLSQDRENAGNPNLVPPQSWELEAEVGRELGAWGKTRLKGYAHKIDDIVDFIPLADHTEGVGNLPHATRFGAQSVSTINFDPIGWAGAKLDATVGFERTRVKDPLTGESRPISGTRNRWFALDLRHDIPKTDWAWGASASYDHYTKNFYLTEINRSWEGPVWLGIYAEHKNVFGLTVRATVYNILDARHRWTRYIYEDWRDDSPIAIVQRNNQLIGPLFILRVKGTF